MAGLVVGAESTHGPGLLAQIAAVGHRSVNRTLRQRALLVFPLLFPLILFAINGSSLGAATRIPGFPTPDYRAFALAVPFIQGALFVAVSTGTDLARDIETGFFNRLAMTPLSGTALLVGQLGGSLVLAFVQSGVYLLVGVATGVGLATGVAGALVLLVLSILISFAFASLGALMALRFGTGEAVQGIFPLLFVTLFLSSSSLPRNLIKTDWFREVATYNPVSYLIEGLRSLIIKGWDAQALALGFGFAALLLTLTLTLAGVAMKSRLVRT
ncbi:MAG TPA: ABC transporter permease [Solirubrobacteraceae bacterium]|nr:ABC transporter permease [Solirubrobacteraceae bacterium]